MLREITRILRSAGVQVHGHVADGMDRAAAEKVVQQKWTRTYAEAMVRTLERTYHTPDQMERVAELVREGGAGAFLNEEDPILAILDFAVPLGTAWAETGYATVELGAKLGASLAATTIPAEYAADVKLPWPALLIAVPPGVLDSGPAGILLGTICLDRGSVRWGRVEAPGSALMRRPRCAFYTLSMTDRESAVAILPSFEAFVDARVREVAALELERGRRITPRFRRVADLLHQIAVGAIIELDSRKVPQPPRLRPGGRVPTDARGNPRVFTFKLTRPVRVDVRDAVRGFVEEGGRSPTVQILVRGHHRRQRFGPGRAEVRWIHIEPYYRGPEDAPLAVRPHRLRDWWPSW